jgi:hypothetical protein
VTPTVGAGGIRQKKLVTGNTGVLCEKGKCRAGGEEGSPVETSEKFEQRFEKGSLWDEDGRKLAAMNVSCHRQEGKGAWKTSR